MAWKSAVLVVANVTATSNELQEALKARAEQGPATFTFILPATPFGGGRDAAKQKLGTALEQLRGAGLEIDGSVGDGDPVIAVSEAWDPKLHDEIIISTLPMRMSKWLHAGLPERIGRITGAPVIHIVSEPPKPAVETAPAPAPEDKSASMGPLSVLGWGAQKQR